jgi:hypothetical protein
MSKSVNYFLSLNALLGVYGVRTSLLQSNQDYWTCAKALWPEVSDKDASLASLQAQIKAMTKTHRKKEAKANICRVPIRFLSEAPKHQKALKISLGMEASR